MSDRRAFLLLQGVCSPFFTCLADRLRSRGHRVYKIHFNAGDWLYWSNKLSWNYRGSFQELADFLENKYQEYGISDQILFGDCRPVHRPAVERGTLLGVRTHVFEEGYFRPFWVTLERGGVNGYSSLPKDPQWYREVAPQLADMDQPQPFPSSFTLRAAHDVCYHLAGCYNPLFFPGYRTHAPVNAAIEYLGCLRRFPTLRWHRRHDDRQLAQLLETGTGFYLLPLQLSADAQIRHHSRFSGMAEVLSHVLASFAWHAPPDTKVVIKNHPLDAGLENYPRLLRQLTDQYALAGRVVYMETGDLMGLLRHARGTVTVNSTVGLLSLARHCPTIALSNPIYNLPGLTFQGPLDAFWSDCEPPRARLFRLFRKTVIHCTQVNGSFYSRPGIDLTIANCVNRLEADRSPLEELL